MTVPGSNLLAMALTVQGVQKVGYLKYAGKTTLANGAEVPAFEPSVDLYGSWQPVNATRVQQYGLEMGKSYAQFYATTPGFTDLARDNSTDRFTFNGRLWQLIDNTAWAAVDGWDAPLLVDIGPDA